MSKSDAATLSPVAVDKYQKQRLRELALNLAHASHDSTSVTVSRAEAYYAFLNKND